MKEKEAAVLLGWGLDSLNDAIKHGVKPVTTETAIKLKVSKDGGSVEITEEDLEQFVSELEKNEPGRHPPIAVRRELRTEAGHRCGVCRRDFLLQFHHIIEWQEHKHHDPQHMIAVCGSCHDKIGAGLIDRKEQRIYKTKLQDAHELRLNPKAEPTLFSSGATAPLSWDSLSQVVEIMHDALVEQESTANSRFDFSMTELSEKNRINRLSEDMFAVMREVDEPYFHRVQSFLEDPRNRETTLMFYEVVDEIRRVIAAKQSSFSDFDSLLNQLYDYLREHFGSQLIGKRRILRTLTSFMYFNCDIGRKE